MAAGDTVVGTGASLEWPVATPWVMEVTSITIDGPEATIVDVSHLGSTTLREKLVGDLLEPGTVTVEGYFKSTIDVDTSYVGQSNTLEINTGSGSVWSWTAAILTSFSATIPTEDVETYTATWQLNSGLEVA